MWTIPRTLLLAGLLLLATTTCRAAEEESNDLVDNLEVTDDDRLFTEFFALQQTDDSNSSLLLRNSGSVNLQPNYELTSPYQAIPGTYELYDNRVFAGNSPYNPKEIFKSYLTTGTFLYHSPACMLMYGGVPKITEDDIAQAFKYAFEQLPIRYPEYINIDSYQGKERKEIEGYYLQLVSEYFAKFKCFSKYQLSTFLPLIAIDKQYQLVNRYGDVSCTAFYNQHYECAKHYNSKFRTIDGSCNNRIHPYWGRSNICHIRLLPPDYADGVQAFRMSKAGTELPSPRLISNMVTPSKDLKAIYSALLLGWGQFINHDISNTEGHKSDPNTKVNCCEKADLKCTTIKVTDSNDLQAKFNNKCFNFMRSSPCPLCKLGPREQMNAQTSFLDGSQIYGATAKETIKLRAMQNGFLAAVSDKLGNPILPPSASAKPCTPVKRGLQCFVAGDGRVNQHPILLAMHTLLMRTHNQHAMKLKLINPQWGDERLFQEARRITIAELQHITYNEYLAVIIGPMLLNYYRLAPLKAGYTNYQPLTNPTTLNEFSTAASRYGHSQIKDFYKTMAGSFSNASIFLLKDNFFEPGFAWDGLLEDVVRGSTNDPVNTIDPFYSLTAKNFIMRPKTQSVGIDLVATNIMRGRDHGLPGYVHYLKVCFNFEAKSWTDLEKFIPKETLSKMKLIYSAVEDIDLYIGGVSEKHFPDASIGPTFSCLVGIQFNHLKFGDRYFYEHGGQSGSFTPGQLANIRQAASMARLLCRSCSQLSQIQPKPFYLPSRFNKPLDCAAYPDINYHLWKE